MHSTLNSKSVFLKNGKIKKMFASCGDNQQNSYLYHALQKLTHRFSTKLYKKEMDNRKWKNQEQPSELSAGRVGEETISTPWTDGNYHTWKASKLCFHAGVRGGNKVWWCLVILAVSSANRHFSSTGSSLTLVMDNESPNRNPNFPTIFKKGD